MNLRSGVLLLGALTMAAGTLRAVEDPGEKVLIRAAKPYAGLVSQIAEAGGKVTYQYKYVDAIAAEIPRGSLATVRRLVPAGAITKDEEISLPADADRAAAKGGLEPQAEEVLTESAEPLSAAAVAELATAHPSAYLINNDINGVSPLHGAGYAGQGVIVAVIDSGIRPGFPHLSSDGSVIGCEDFVGDALGCSNSGNNFHGTFVAGMISANVTFSFATTSAFRNAVLAECPACFLNPPSNTQIPMIGTAPLSSIYALRVFGPTGGAPTSRILAAVERAIELREKYDAGDPAGSNIQVCNMSLGGSTVFAGRDLFDTAVDVMLQKGIVSTISAANTGPSSLTVGSPGSSMSTITVGAASLAHNERILRRLQLGAPAGSLYRPFLGTQTAYFSSRGPNADGRGDPDVTANGFASYGQGSGATTSITLASGTSFSSPSVAGVAAVLRQRFPAATAWQIRNAIIASADPNVLDDGSTSLDQGYGYVDAAAASELLAAGTVPAALPEPKGYNKSVKVNVEKNTTLDVRDAVVQEAVPSLLPGERYDILYRVHPNTRQVIIHLSGVTPALPPAQQNQLFGDDILLAVHSAKTSAIDADGDYPVFAFTLGGTWVLNDPETGLIRVTVNGDWTNAGAIEAYVTIGSTTEPIPQLTAQGKIAQSQQLVYPVNIPAGVAQAEFRAGWREDWGNYPSADVDLILVAPNGTLNLAGATISNPEVATVNNPAPGTWLVLLEGFDVPTGWDKFELRVSLDGKVVK